MSVVDPKEDGDQLAPVSGRSSTVHLFNGEPRVMAMTYLSLFHVERPVYDEAVAVGDTVTVGADQFHQYEVMALRGQKAWLRESDTGMDSIVVAVRCRLISRSLLRDIA